MAMYLATDTEITSIADAIRTKGGTSAALVFPTDFVTAIQNIPTGITPTGTYNISTNGVYDITNYANVDVDVSAGAGIVIEDTIDPIAGGTIREITAVDLSHDTVQATKMFAGYTAHDSTGTAITGTFTGTAIPTGWVLFNGYLLPEIPTGDGYDYYWIRANGSTGNFDLVKGTAQWYAASNSGLNAWSLTYANMTTVGTKQYSIPMDSQEQSTTASDWGEPTISTASSYGTGNNRKPIFTSHDIIISGSTNILLRHGFPVRPTTS